MNSLELYFNSNSYLRVLFKDRSNPENIYIKSFKLLSNGFLLKFQEGINFYIINKNDKIFFQFESGLRNITWINIPFNKKDDYDLRDRNYLSGLIIHSDFDSYLLSLQKDSYVSKYDFSIRIPYKKDNLIIYSLIQNENYKSINNWFKDHNVDININDYDKIVDSYINKVIINIKNRYDSESGYFIDPYTKKKYYSEDAIIMILSYFLSKNNKDDYNIMQKEFKRKDDLTKASYLSGVFLGSLIERYKNTNALFLKDESRILKKLDNEIDIKHILNDKNLFFKIFFSYQNSSSKILNYIMSLNFNSLTLENLTYLLVNNYFYGFKLEELDYIFKPIKKAFFLKIANYLKVINNGVFINYDNAINTYLSVVIGAILKKEGENLKDKDLIKLGKMLILSSLNLADENGFIIRNMEYIDSYLIQKDDFLKPEDLYIFINKDQFYPKHNLFIDNRNIFDFYNLGSILDFKIENKKYSFKIKNIINDNNYIYVLNIDNIKDGGVNMLNLNNIKNNKNFENYANGRYYDSRFSILALKINSNRDTETIEIELN